MDSSNTNVSVILSASRLVIKIGSSLITDEGKGLDKTAIANWVEQIAILHQIGKQIILVSSGAVAEGMARLKWTLRPSNIHELQAAAAIGQIRLCQAYEVAFSNHNLHTAQILLTHEDLIDHNRYLNTRSALISLLQLGVIPIINENDSIVTKEIRLGDNDTLGALITNLIKAEALIILTDQNGLYDSDPRKNPAAKLIKHAYARDPELEIIAGGAGTDIGTGGMLTKISAAKRATLSGAVTIIASGRENHVLTRLSRGECIGTELSINFKKYSEK